MLGAGEKCGELLNSKDKESKKRWDKREKLDLKPQESREKKEKYR